MPAQSWVSADGSEIWLRFLAGESGFVTAVATSAAGCARSAVSNLAVEQSRYRTLVIGSGGSGLSCAPGEHSWETTFSQVTSSNHDSVAFETTAGSDFVTTEPRFSSVLAIHNNATAGLLFDVRPTPPGPTVRIFEVRLYTTSGAAVPSGVCPGDLVPIAPTYMQVLINVCTLDPLAALGNAGTYDAYFRGFDDDGNEFDQLVRFPYSYN